MKTLIVVVISKQRTIGATLIITLAVALGVIIAVATAVARIDIDAPAWVARVRCGSAVAISVVVAEIIEWLTLDLPLLIIRVVAGEVIHRCAGLGRAGQVRILRRHIRRCCCNFSMAVAGPAAPDNTSCRWGGHTSHRAPRAEAVY